ncbi:MAG: hypothetical protein ACTSQ8_19980 [Candidatus Helarchaeota archaeon]
MVYYVIADRLQIKQEFKNEAGELVLCPEIGLGLEELAEPQLSVPFFINSIQNILGPYRLEIDDFFHRISIDEVTSKEDTVTIEIGKSWGDPRYKFQIAGIELIFHLPSIKTRNQKPTILYAFINLTMKGLSKRLQNYMRVEEITASSFNFGAVNSIGDELLRNLLNIEDEPNPETGYPRRGKVTEIHRLSLKKEISFVEIFRDLGDLIKKTLIFEKQLKMLKEFEKTSSSE